MSQLRFLSFRFQIFSFFFFFFLFFFFCFIFFFIFFFSFFSFFFLFFFPLFFFFFFLLSPFSLSLLSLPTQSNLSFFFSSLSPLHQKKKKALWHLIQTSKGVTAVCKTFHIHPIEVAKISEERFDSKTGQRRQPPPTITITEMTEQRQRERKGKLNVRQERIEVDVVCHFGAVWLKLRATSVAILFAHWMGRTQGNQKKDVVSQATRGFFFLFLSFSFFFFFSFLIFFYYFLNWILFIIISNGSSSKPPPS